MNSSKLSEIISPIKNELTTFNQIFKSSMKSKVGLVDLIANYILKQKGKKIRPILVLLSAALSGGINERTYRGAVLVELLHTATLVHDDVVDAADKRRGFPSINAVWKNKIAVLMGDYLLSRGLLLSVENNDFDFLNIITDTVKRMSEGELLQIQKTRKLDITEEVYFQIISDKTASLIQTCCQVGVFSSTDDERFRNALKDFGHYLGISFQIRDDILDYEGSSKLFGKPIGGDIKEKKITLPLIYSLAAANKDEAARIKKLVKNSSKKGNIQEVISFVEKMGGLDYAYKTSVEYSKKAKDSLSIFPDNEFKNSLIRLVDFTVERKI